MQRIFLGIAILIAHVSVGAAAADEFYLRDGQRVVFLGDSNTYAGGFIAYLDAYLFTRFPDWKVELVNLGLPSETASGLSEPDHPYPRPCVHERLERALARTKPDVVVVCYGMNDGIYHPDSGERFAAYKEGMRKLIDQCEKTKAKIVLMTPAPFDPLPLKGKTLPRTAKKFSWVHPFQDYDEALTRYSAWLVSLRKKGFRVADPHTALNNTLTQIRKAKPTYSFSGDGIHPNATGHWLIAQELLRALSAPADADAADIDFKSMKVTHGHVRKVTKRQDAMQFTWMAHMPLPISPQWDADLPDGKKSADRWNTYRLTVTDAPAEKYTILVDNKVSHKASREQLGRGLRLAGLGGEKALERAAELAKLTEQRQRLLGAAWLDDVGHKRPDTPKGLPLKEGQKRAREMEVKIRELAQPIEISLRLEPIR